MFYNFKDKTIVSLNNVRCVYIYKDRPNTEVHWYVGIKYIDGEKIEFNADNYEDAQKELHNIELKLLTNH